MRKKESVIEKENLPNGWVLFTFGECLTLQYGKGLTKNQRKSGSIPVYGSSGKCGNHNVSLIEKHCLIIGRKGSAGEIHYVIEPCWPIDTTYFLTCTPLYDLTFLYYYFIHIKNKLIGSSTAIPSLRRVDVYALSMILPPLSEQKRIVAKIESIFTQIDAAQKRLEILASQVKSYSDSFNMLRNSILKQAFEGKLISQVPNNESTFTWLENLSLLSEQIDNFQKRNPKDEPEKEFKYVEIGGIRNNKISNFKKILGKNAPSRARNVLRKNDVIYATTRPYYRNVILISEDFDNEICSTGFCVLRSNDSKLESMYLFYYMLSDAANNQILPAMKGSNYPEISKSAIKKLYVDIPPHPEQKRIVSKIESIFDRIDAIPTTHKITHKIATVTLAYLYA